MPKTNTCECGCGTPVERRFVHGHNLERKGSKPTWTLEAVIAVLQDAARERGRPLTWEEWRHERRHPGTTTIAKRAGSWSNALVLADIETFGYESQRKWDDNEQALARLRNGVSLTALARERGVTPQALGRRLRRHIRAVGSDPVAPLSGRGRRTGGLWAA